MLRQIIIAACVAAMKSPTITNAQKTIVVYFLAHHDDGVWGQEARRQIAARMNAISRSLHDVITPKPMIALRPLAKGQLVTTSDVMGFGAAWFGKQQRGQA